MKLHVDEGNRIVKVEGDPNHPANSASSAPRARNARCHAPATDRLSQAHIRSLRAETPHRSRSKEAIRPPRSGCARSSICTVRTPSLFMSPASSRWKRNTFRNKLGERFIRTNNIDSNSRLCMSSAASGYKLSLGADGPPGSYQDFEHADLFLRHRLEHGGVPPDPFRPAHASEKATERSSSWSIRARRRRRRRPICTS